MSQVYRVSITIFCPFTQYISLHSPVKDVDRVFSPFPVLGNSLVKTVFHVERGDTRGITFARVGQT